MFDRLFKISVCISMIILSSPQVAMADSGHIWFATNRDKDKSQGYFGDTRVPDITFGTATLSNGHLNVGELPDLSTLPNGPITVFVHGYNTPFSRAVETAQDLASTCNTPVVLFSWPSKGTVLALHTTLLARVGCLACQTYIQDVENAEASAPALNRLLVELSHYHPTNLVAHSMGNLVLFDALESQNRKILGRIFMLSPDIDRDRFDVGLMPILNSADTTFVFLNPYDKTLQLSTDLSSLDRLGKAWLSLETKLSQAYHMNVVDYSRIAQEDGRRDIHGHAVPYDLIADMINYCNPSPGAELQSYRPHAPYIFVAHHDADSFYDEVIPMPTGRNQ
jgi:hypothetical protein